MIEFQGWPSRVVAFTVLGSVSYYALSDGWRRDPAILPFDGAQTHVPMEGPAPSSSPIGSNLPSMSASGSFSVLHGAGGDNSHLWLLWPSQS